MPYCLLIQKTLELFIDAGILSWETILQGMSRKDGFV